jgi:hypothetical protein
MPPAPFEQTATMINILILFLLPFTILAQGTPVGNPNGAILGIYAMCGTNPVDCKTGWCCVAGQQCLRSTSTKGNPLCMDSSVSTLPLQNRWLTPSRSSGATVNAAYFGTLQPHQAAPNVTSTTTGVLGGATIISAAPSTRPMLLSTASVVAATVAFLLLSV